MPHSRMSIVNVSAYRFVSLDDLPMLRERMRERCAALDLKGTILLAPEGINLFLAGSRARIDAFIDWLHEDPRFAAVVPKESLSGTVPFRRLRVRLKQEIITMRQPAIRPEGGRAPALDAVTLQRWLAQGHDDDGRALVMLDTRNDYETALGTFADAVDYQLASFTGFPAAIAADRERYAGKTVVSYCTGGIRCEKAALHMRDLGMSHVYQLEGGILNYLELTDGRYWRGDCFVFDERVALDKQLRALPPLPCGESAEVRGHAGDGAEPGRPSISLPASIRPSSQPSPLGEEANATSTELDWSGA